MTGNIDWKDVLELSLEEVSETTLSIGSQRDTFAYNIETNKKLFVQLNS